MKERSYDVIYSSTARDDLINIYSYIAYDLEVPHTAEKVVNKIRSTIRSLESMPGRFPVVEWEPWKSRKVHHVPVGNFLVFYGASKESYTVTILRIVYGGRDIDSSMV